MTMSHDVITVLPGDTLHFTAKTSSETRDLQTVYILINGHACRNCGQQWKFDCDAPSFCFYLIEQYCGFCHAHFNDHHEGKCFFAASYFSPFKKKVTNAEHFCD